MPRSGCPPNAPDPHQRRLCLPAGITMETVTATHMERRYRFDSGDRSGLTITWRPEILPGPMGKKTKIHESHPKLKERSEPEARSPGILSYFYGCWKVCQGGRRLTAFRKLQSAYHESLPLEVRKAKSPLENICPSVQRKTVKTLASYEKACGTEDKKMAHCWKRKSHVLTHGIVRFGSRTLAHARGARWPKRRKETKLLTHNLLRFGSRILVGTKRAAEISDQEESAGVTYQRRGFSACQL
ncbi:uncharacterized protein LOC141569018 [Rhinolophus sinicus]|uniref:uncharacterized protein LOC141569018 n=1 Tax=Rhinolophus sinicus TaxID=89399 RepID=UPI003D79727D